MRIFFSVGEPSGDLHGANLIRALREECEDVQCVGYGGPKMAAAGCELHEDLTQFAVMWFGEAIKNLGRFWALYQRARESMRRDPPDAVVLIDYPGFNWWIAKAAKECGVPVFYYGAPQLWAWASWRIRKMRRLIDHVLCKLPFEAHWYQERGCNAHFVGHPYFDELKNRTLDEAFLKELQKSGKGSLVAVLPGSRRLEVKNNLPWFLKAVEKIREQAPETRFAIASFNEQQAQIAREISEEAGVSVDIHVERTPELIAAAHCCMACSGSVSLELLYHQTPSVILYWVNRFFYSLARFVLLKVRYITLVNLLAAEDRFSSRPRPYDPELASDRAIPFPEYPTCEDKSDELAGHVLRWLEDKDEHARRVGQLKELAETLGGDGASRTAASYIMRTLRSDSSQRAAA